jgi:hypothetical protein
MGMTKKLDGAYSLPGRWGTICMMMTLLLLASSCRLTKFTRMSTLHTAQRAASYSQAEAGTRLYLGEVTNIEAYGGTRYDHLDSRFSPLLGIGATIGTHDWTLSGSLDGYLPDHGRAEFIGAAVFEVEL